LPAGIANVRFEKEDHRPEVVSVNIDADTDFLSCRLWRKVVFKIFSQETRAPVSARAATEHFSRTGAVFEEFIPYGNIRLTVSKSNYRTKSMVIAGEGHSENVYIEPVYPVLTVKVEDSQGQPISAAFVKLGTKQNISRVEGMTDAAGEWRENVSAVNDFITAGRAEYETKSQSIGLEWGRNRSVNFVLERVFSGTLIVDPRGYRNGADIYIDGGKQQYTQFLMTNIRGRKEIRVEWPSAGKTASEKIKVSNDGERVIVKFTSEGELYVERK